MVILLLVTMLLVGCEAYATYTPSAYDLTRIAEDIPPGPTRDMIQGTAVARYIAAQEAQGTITAAQAVESAARAELERQTLAMTAEAQSTVQAQQIEAWKTTQALDARATTQALDALATAQRATATANARNGTATAEAAITQAAATAESRNATATVESAHATATATAAWATQTRQAQREAITQTVEAAQAVFAGATVTAVHQQTEIDDDRQALTTFGGWALLIIGYGLLAYVLYQLLPIIKVKIGQIPRDERGDLPAMATATPGGAVFIYDPTRGFGPATIIDQAVKRITQPLLTPTINNQEGTTKRSQFVDMVKGGRARPVIAHQRMNGGPPPAPQGEPWRVEENQDERPVNWPSKVLLPALFADREPSLNHLVIGVYPQPDGRQAVVGASLHQLMHVLAVGASGWGKSVWLRVLLWQLAQVREPVGVVAVDVNGSEFNMLQGWSRLRYPVARTMGDAVATLRAVSGEIARRKGLYEHYPLATKLPEYNRLSDEHLEPWVIVVDEGTALLNEKEIGDPLREVVQTARQYGVYLVLAGQSAHHQVINTQTRDNFSTRMCFKTSPSSSRVVLDDKRAGDLVVRGRAWAQLTGREILEIQAPYVSRMELDPLLERGTVRQLPPQAEPECDAQEQRIAELLEMESQLSDSTIAQIVYGYQNARVTEKVREIRRCLDNRQTDDGV